MLEQAEAEYTSEFETEFSNMHMPEITLMSKSKAGDATMHAKPADIACL